MEKDRLIDQQYFQNNETQRNMWFNYSDPYFVDNQDVKQYQKEIVEKEKKMKNKNNNTNINNSNNVYQATTPNENYQKEYVEQTDCNNRNSSLTERQSYHENCDNFKADTQSASNYTQKNSSNKNTQDKSNKQQTTKNVKNPTETTRIFEPLTDMESHINFNTAPQYAGDNQYASGGQVINKNTVGYENFETADDYQENNQNKNYDKSQNCQCMKNNQKSCNSQNCNSTKQQSKKPANTNKNYNYYDTDYTVNHDGNQNRED